MKKYISLAVLIVVMTVLAASMLMRKAINNAHTATAVAYRIQQDNETVRDLGDGFLTKTRGEYVLVKFPDKYLTDEKVFKEGFGIALVKLYGEVYRNAVVTLEEDSVVARAKDHKITAGALVASDTDGTIAGVVFKKPE